MRTDRPDTTAYPQQVCTVLLPLAIHWAVSSAAFMLCDSLIPNRPGADGLIPSALTAVICIPVFMRMHKEQQERQLAGQHVRKRAGQKKKRGAGQQERQQAGQQERQRAAQQERQRADQQMIRRGDLRSCALAFAVGAAAAVLVSLLLAATGLRDLFSNEAQEGLLSAPLWQQLPVLGVLTPLCEELLFRGVMYERWCAAFGSSTAGLGVTALFAQYHGNPIQILYALPMGAALAWLRRRFNRLHEPLAFHAGANLASVLLNAAGFIRGGV